MSMTIYVLSDTRLRSIAEWQAAVDNEAFPLRFVPDGSDSKAVGNLRMQLRDKETEIECGFDDFDELEQTYPNVSFGHDWKYVLAFTWSTKIMQATATWMAATAYARAAAGVVFEAQEGKLLTAAQSLSMVREIERSLPEIEAMFEELAQQRSAKP
jgi:hypothetical protein